ncbi:hypothetical protein [Alloalcanivorax marinus]|nr:hypothetical protein [Alloalcanivorax marinus]
MSNEAALIHTLDKAKNPANAGPWRVIKNLQNAGTLRAMHNNPALF